MAPPSDLNVTSPDYLCAPPNPGLRCARFGQESFGFYGKAPHGTKQMPPRWNGTLANMPEFQKAFSSKPTDALVHSRPCRIW